MRGVDNETIIEINGLEKSGCATFRFSFSHEKNIYNQILYILISTLKNIIVIIFSFSKKKKTFEIFYFQNLLLLLLLLFYCFFIHNIYIKKTFLS